MRPTFKLSRLMIFAVIVMALATVYASAQPRYKAKRLRLPAAVSSNVGGESQEHYVFRVRRNQRINIGINWIREDDNNASFSVSGSRNFEDNKFLRSVRESNGGKNWTGIATATRDYYVYVVAYPSAQYTLRVSVR